MIQIDPTILIIMGEVILALIVVIGAALIYFLKLRKRDKQAVEVLQKRLEGNAEQRQEKLEELITQAGADSEAEGSSREVAQQLVDKENGFYNRLVEIYMQRNSTALKSLDKLLHDHTSSYLDLVSLMRNRAESQQAGLPDEMKEQLGRLEQDGQKLASEVEKLKEENQRLSRELEDAYSEIDRAMREYSQVFHPDNEAAERPDDSSVTETVDVEMAEAMAEEMEPTKDAIEQAVAMESEEENQDKDKDEDEDEDIKGS